MSIVKRVQATKDCVVNGVQVAKGETTLIPFKDEAVFQEILGTGLIVPGNMPVEKIDATKRPEGVSEHVAPITMTPAPIKVHVDEVAPDVIIPKEPIIDEDQHPEPEAVIDTTTENEIEEIKPDQPIDVAGEEVVEEKILEDKVVEKPVTPLNPSPVRRTTGRGNFVPRGR